MIQRQTLAVIIPCYNEELTVGSVVEDMRTELPDARIFVFDNNSSDRTAEVARSLGVEVISSPRQGKGNVVRHSFDAVDSDIYILIDGDGTYSARDASKLIAVYLDSGADMVVGSRLNNFGNHAFRRFHLFGNHFISWIISALFDLRVRDVLSGYRVIGRDFAKTAPLTSKGFEVETEMTLQAVAKGFIIKEEDIAYKARPPGSESKLSTFNDGFLIIKAIVKIFKDYKPFLFFTSLSVFLGALSFGIGLLPIMDYYEDGYVDRVPLAVLAAGVGILSALCFAVGLLLDTIKRYHNETFEMWRKASNRRTNSE